MTKILAFSDIHNNTRCVELMRAQERNCFDAILVAGDIGSEKFNEILQILSSFSCPTYIVLGNWDNNIAYDISFPDNIHLVHHNEFQIEELYVTGYSGCPTHWGLNPIYQSVMEEILHRHKSIRTTLEESINFSKNRSGRNKNPPSKIRRSKPWNDYVKDLRAAKKTVLDLNRKKVDEILQDRGDTNAIVLAHERISKFHERDLTPLLHVFGHRHTYAHTIYKGSNYVNVAALDIRLAAFPRSDEDQFRYLVANAGGYSVFTYQKGKLSVERRNLTYDEKRWDYNEYLAACGNNIPNDVEYCAKNSPYLTE